MGRIRNIKRWFFVHKWTSLICTVFLLMLCITGLPLIFADEIDEALNPDPPYAVMPANTPLANIDSMIAVAKLHYPGQVVSSVFADDDEPQVMVAMLPHITDEFNKSHSLQFDSRTGKLLKDEPPITQQPQTFIGFMFELHANMFAELPGELFLGLMGVLFVLAIISGIVLYGPYMKKLRFGTVRYEQSKRLKWLDLHNLMGIVVAAWMLVVGITGVINELSTPLFALWRNTDVEKMLSSYKGRPVPAQQELKSIQAAFDTAKKAVPGMTVISLLSPGNEFGTPYHYLLFAKGNKALTSRLFSPVLVDARTGKLQAVVNMPGYLRALEVSRPLHFGDYGGIPLKILWVLFDLASIMVLISGLYLWIVRRKSRDAWIKRMIAEETTVHHSKVPDNATTTS